MVSFYGSVSQKTQPGNPRKEPRSQGAAHEVSGPFKPLTSCAALARFSPIAEIWGKAATPKMPIIKNVQHYPVLAGMAGG
jgi:hypothetical protein